MTAARTVADPWDVRGQAHAVAVLRRGVREGSVGHALAFVGPAGVGQEQAARALMASLNCPVGAAGQPCGTCDDCSRALRGVHPAATEFAPAGGLHRVADVRERWLPAASTTAGGAAKVLRVLEAERMNEAAANAFLKALEEPPAGTVWVLEVADPDQLPDTVLSRCRQVRFLPWSREDLAEEARTLGLDGERLSSGVGAALGSPARLRVIASDDGLERLGRHRALLRRLRAEGSGVALVLAREIEQEGRDRAAAAKQESREELAALDEAYADAAPRAVRSQIEERGTRAERDARLTAVIGALDDLLGWLRDVLVVRMSGVGDEGVLVHRAEVAALRADADALDPTALLSMCARIERVREDLLEFNLQPTLTLEALFLELAELAHRSD